MLLGSGIFTIQEEGEGEMDDHRSDGRRSNSSRSTRSVTTKCTSAVNCDQQPIDQVAARDRPELHNRSEAFAKCNGLLNAAGQCSNARPSKMHGLGKHDEQAHRTSAGNAIRKVFLSVVAGHVMHSQK